jgi:hypothetical protein
MAKMALLKNDNNSFVVINENNPDKFDYVNNGYMEVCKGKRTYIEEQMELAWDELDIPEEERIFVEAR